MACHPTFFKFFRFYNNKPIVKILETDRRRQMNEATIFPGIQPLENFQIFASLTCHIIKSTQKLLPALTFTYELGLMNRSHRCDHDEEIYALVLIINHSDHFYV